MLMWIRVARGRVDPARIDENSTFGQDITAAFRQLPGFQSFMSGTDRATGQVITVSTFDTEEHARFSRDALGGDIQSRMQARGTQVDPPEFYEVAIQA